MIIVQWLLCCRVCCLACIIAAIRDYLGSSHADFPLGAYGLTVFWLSYRRSWSPIWWKLSIGVCGWRSGVLWGFQEGFLVTGILIPLIYPIETPLWMMAVAAAYSR